jgi:hypothetical protein
MTVITHFKTCALIRNPNGNCCTCRGGQHSIQYVRESLKHDHDVWEAPAPYVLGVQVFWRSVRLVCTRAHYAGDAAHHPWDPGYGWDAVKASTLWAPDGEDESKKLYRAIYSEPNFSQEDEVRLRQIVGELTWPT